MNPQQSVIYNTIIEDFNENFQLELRNGPLRLGQTFYNYHAHTIYNHQPNPTLFYETDNNTAMALILKDIENHVKGSKYKCTDQWYIDQCEQDEKMNK